MHVCNENPQYLTQNIPDENFLVMAISSGFENIQDIKRPVDILKERLSRENFGDNQFTECYEIYKKCLNSENFEAEN